MTVSTHGSMTMAAATGKLHERLSALSREFGEALGERIGKVRRLWAAVSENTPIEDARSSLKQIHEIVHALAGSGKSFGFPQVSLAAAPLDGLFRILIEADQTLNAEEVSQIELLVQGLERSACIPAEPLLLEGLEPGNGTARERAVIQVLIVSGDRESSALSEALVKFGYPCATVREASDIPADVGRGRSAILLADLADGAERLKALRADAVLARLPLIVASAQTGFEARLRAVRMGATMFLPKPYDLQDVVKLVVSAEESLLQRSYRIVIAEDERTLGHFYQMTLEHAGMDVRVVNEPSKLLDAISGFDPDLIIMDVYMGECTGLELAQIVRQFPAYTTVPILFLSTESRLELQLQARHFGGDDFLVKPLEPSQLISAVVSRSNRYRDLKKLTDRDSLTGLLNHTNILRNLEREISVAARSGAPVAFCMADIDHFKKVNDTYGHVVGDRVIAQVSHLLRNRLRRVDYVGRYGGEEFAVVMPNTDAAKARSVMNALREAAEAMEYSTEKGSFRVTFSCGVATYPQYGTTEEVTHAADTALYEAKRAGRNRVVVSAPQ